MENFNRSPEQTPTPEVERAKLQGVGERVNEVINNRGKDPYYEQLAQSDAKPAKQDETNKEIGGTIPNTSFQRSEINGTDIKRQTGSNYQGYGNNIDSDDRE